MDILIKKLNQNLRYTMREVGYMEKRDTRTGQLSYERPLQGIDYPRFHIYPVPEPSARYVAGPKNNNGGIILKLHLDQKKPSYEGSTAHSGEYKGETVANEAERIKNVLKISNF